MTNECISHDDLLYVIHHEQLMLKQLRANPRNCGPFMHHQSDRRLWVLEATCGEDDPFETSYLDGQLYVRWNANDDEIEIYETEGFCVGKDSLNEWKVKNK